MKILLSYPGEYDVGEGIHYARVLRRMGHDVFEINSAVHAAETGAAGRGVRGYPPETTIEELMHQSGGAGLFLYIEPLGLIPRGLERSPIPTACVISDVHRNLEMRQKLSRFFDRVFLYQRNYIDRFDEHPPGAVTWSPYACDTGVFRDLGRDRDLDVGFVGKKHSDLAWRAGVLEKLKQRYRMNEDRRYLQQEIPEVYSRAKIVLDLPGGGDLTFRFFEAMSCGAMLLTERCTNGQEDLFREGEHFAAFSNHNELEEKVAYYLSHDGERTRIAKAGYEQIQTKHTLTHRLKGILEAVGGEPKRGAPIREMSERDVLRNYAIWYERTGRIEALLRLAAESRGKKLQRWGLLGQAGKAFARRVIRGW